MSGYRCVNYYELCRLCTTSNGNKVNIFSEENKRKNLSSKIIDVLPVLHLDEKDKLPKIICTQCLQNIETYAEFRETSINAQNMLQSCLNSTKLCNGGQVYIKDASVKKAAAAPQTLTLTSPLKNEISLTPIANNTATLMTPSSDFLSTIMQAVGIQQSEENEMQPKMATTQQVTSSQNTQFRITFDTNSMKNSNQVQYKIQQEPPTTSLITTTAATTSTNEQNQTTLAQVNEFLKMKTGPNVTLKRPEVSKLKPEPKLKKPKMQIITSPVKPATKTVQQPQHQPPPQQQQQQQQPQHQIQIQKAIKGATIAMPIKTQVQTLPQQTSPLKSTPLQFQDIKFVSAANKCMVPLVLKNSGDATQQIFTQFAATSDSKPVAYLQMKIEPNSDGQPCVQLTPTQMPATLQLTSQQLQQFGFQPFQPAQIQTQPAQNTNTQQFQIFSPQTISTPVTTAATAAPTMQTNTTASQTQTLDEPEDDGDYCDDAMMDSSQLDTSEEVEEVKPQEKPAAPTRKKNSPMSVQQNTPTSSSSTRSYSTLSQIPKHQSALASKQLDAISLHKDPTTPAKAVVVNENQEPVEETFSLTKCQVCGKEFKKKEHCMQHLKTHIGLRPFVCQDKSGCNKSFNRKEHLLRHVVSHTGKKMFNCDLCHKYFSRKDNLNKHRRTHPEAGAASNLPYQCEMCERSFVAKSQYLKHKAIHENQSSDSKEDDDPPPATNVAKLPNKNRTTGKPVPVRKVKQESTETKNEDQPQEQQQHSQPPALQIIKQQQPAQHTTNAQISAQIHPSQIIQIMPPMMSTSNAQTITINQQDHQQQQQQQKTTIIKTLNADGNTTVYTIPSNLIINPAQFMTAGEMMGNFKIENAN